MGIVRALSGLRVAGILLTSAVLAGCAVAYGLFVAGQQQYLIGRNFRLLSTVSRQFDHTLRSEARVLESLVGNDNDLTREWAWSRLPRSLYSAADLPRTTPYIPDPIAEYRVERQSDARVRLVLRSRNKPAAPPVEVLLSLDGLLGPILTPKIEQRAFDTLVLATAKGDVLFARGRRVDQLAASGLDALFPPATDKDHPRRSFEERARTTAVETVSVAGVDYKLFMQPCCAPTIVHEDKSLVIAGLVETSVLRSQSWAISTTLVKLAVMAILLALIGWPFLKLGLMGERQHVRLADLFQLGVSTVAGLGIATIVLLDGWAYWQLNGHRDLHLKSLAESLDRHATREIAAAHRQLACLERYMRRYSKDQGALVNSVLNRPDYQCEVDASMQPDGISKASQPEESQPVGAKREWAYPFFNTFSLIDHEGVQRIKVVTTDWVPSAIDVSERNYFTNPKAGRGWVHPTMCPGPRRCTLESIWSWTTGEPEAVLARASTNTNFQFASIAIPMRSLIRPVLPPGFEFAVIDRTGTVLFHSDHRRNISENFFEETDDNRRLRAQVAAHSEEPLNLRYWGAAYRAYVKPLAVPDAYVIAMYQKERGWAINREWLVVALVFLAGYLTLWLLVAMATLLPDASWVWPDPNRHARYFGVIVLNAALIVFGGLVAWRGDTNTLLFWPGVLSLAGWLGTFVLLRWPPDTRAIASREPLVAYASAAVLLLIVSGVLPGALLFLASFQIHAQSYIKNSQLTVANALSKRFERLSDEYGDRAPALTSIGRLSDYDLYFDFLYDTCIRDQDESSCAGTPADARAAAWSPDGPHRSPPSPPDTHDSDWILALLEDYLPYYSEASVEWRELLHDHADDGSWDSKTTPGGKLVLQLTHDRKPGPLVISTIPSLRGTARSVPHVSRARQSSEEPDAGMGPAGTSGREHYPEHTAAATSDRRQDGDIVFLLIALGVGLALPAAIVYTLMRRVFLVGVTEPLWASVRLAANAGDNIFVLRDERTKGQQIAGTFPLKLGAMVRQAFAPHKPTRQRDAEIRLEWRKTLIDLDRRDRTGGAVLIDDFDEDLDDTAVMESKLTLLEELVGDPSRTVILVSRLSPTGLGDSLRGLSSARGTETPGERWWRLVRAFIVVDWRGVDSDADGAQPAVDVQRGLEPASSDAAPATPSSPAAAWWCRIRTRLTSLRTASVRDVLNTEARSHPFVNRVCAELRESEAVRTGQVMREQALDEIAERTAQFYKRIWESCSEDEKVVLGHIAQHGLANASVRTVVRRLLGRGLLHKDPALRPMNETFRRFVLSKRCRLDVARLEASADPSAWDRLRVPLAIGVVALGVFLFTTQKELYNAILGMTTAAAVSVPTLIRAIGILAGRRMPDGDNPRD